MPVKDIADKAKRKRRSVDIFGQSSASLHLVNKLILWDNTNRVISKDKKEKKDKMGDC